MNYNRLKDIISKNNLTIEQAANKINLTAAGFHYAVKNETFKVRDIEKLAIVLNVPVTYFFSDQEDCQAPDVDKVMNALAKIIKKEIL